MLRILRAAVLQGVKSAAHVAACVGTTAFLSQRRLVPDRQLSKLKKAPLFIFAVVPPFRKRSRSAFLLHFTSFHYIGAVTRRRIASSTASPCSVVNALAAKSRRYQPFAGGAPQTCVPNGDAILSSGLAVK